MIYDRYVIIDCELNRRTTSFKGHAASYICLETSELNTRFPALSELTNKSKIIIIGHGSPGSGQVEADKNSKTPDQTITTEELASFLFFNLDKEKIKPTVAFSESGRANGSAAVSARSPLYRRLTIQLCVCSAADSSSRYVNNSFQKKLYKNITQRRIDHNLIGYSTLVMSTGALPGYRDLSRIYPTGKEDLSEAEQSNFSRATREKNKIIYNAENPDGANYDLDWRQFKVDVLGQLKIELERPEWNSRGVGFLSKKVPQGIEDLRELFAAWDNWTDDHYEPSVHDQLANSALYIISSRLQEKSRFRSSTTSDFYKKYNDALEMCTGEKKIFLKSKYKRP